LHRDKYHDRQHRREDRAIDEEPGEGIQSGVSLRLRLGPGAHRNKVGFDLSVRCEDLLKTGDNDLVVRIKAGLHYPQAIMDATKHDVLAPGLVFRPKDIDVFAI